MKLVPIFFPFDNELGYIKAVVQEEHLDFFEPLGQFYFATQEIPDPATDVVKDTKSPAIVVEVNPDKGYGQPGSLEWYENNILVFETIPEVVAYAKSITGKEVYPGGKLAEVKQRALTTIKEHIENDSQSQ